MVLPALDARLRYDKRDPEGDRGDSIMNARPAVVQVWQIAARNTAREAHAKLSTSCAGVYGVGAVTVEDEGGVFSRSVAVGSAHFRAGGVELTRVALDAAAELAPKGAGKRILWKRGRKARRAR